MTRAPRRPGTHRRDRRDLMDGDACGSLLRRCRRTSPETQVAGVARVARVAGVAGARDAGMATAEYAIATLAACGFAGVLVAILASGEVRGLLLGIVRQALSVG